MNLSHFIYKKKILVILSALSLSIYSSSYSYSSTEEIKIIQKTLDDFGYSVENTGELDDLTKEAIKEFQSDHAVDTSGEIDENFYKLLFNKSISLEKDFGIVENLTDINKSDHNKEIINFENQTLDFSNWNIEDMDEDTKIYFNYPKGIFPYNPFGAKQIIDYAKTFEGIPYIWGGSTPNGFDCSGFVQYVYKQNGIDLPRTADIQALEGWEIPKEELRPGDLVFFAKDMKNISHVGIYVGNDKMIHASSGYKKVTYDDLTREYRVEHFVGARRVFQ